MRPGTRAARFTDPVDPSTVEKRRQQLLRSAEKVGYELRDDFVGREMSVLVESDNKGHTENFLPVQIIGKSLRPHAIVKARLLKNTPEGLIAQLAPYFGRGDELIGEVCA